MLVYGKIMNENVLYGKSLNIKIKTLTLPNIILYNTLFDIIFLN